MASPMIAYSPTEYYHLPHLPEHSLQHAFQNLPGGRRAIEQHKALPASTVWPFEP